MEYIYIRYIYTGQWSLKKVLNRIKKKSSVQTLVSTLNTVKYKNNIKCPNDFCQQNKTKQNKITVCLVTVSLRLRIRVRGDECGDFCLVTCVSGAEIHSHEWSALSLRDSCRAAHTPLQFRSFCLSLPGAWITGAREAFPAGECFSSFSWYNIS